MNNPSAVKFAVVGCGNIGSRHLAVLDAQSLAKIVGLCDIDPAKRQKFSESFGGVPSYGNYEELLRCSDADVINICTPHNFHAPMAIAAANAGRHVLVEKPMALTTSDAQAMIDAADKNAVRLMVVKQNRYNVPVVLTKKALDDCKLGSIYMVQCNVFWNRHDEYYLHSDWRGRKASEGGALYTQGSHFIDLMLWWFGEVVDARAEIATKNHAIEIEDCGAAFLRFSSGVLGTLSWTTCCYKKNYEGSITIIGAKGTIKIGGQYLNKIEHWDVHEYLLPDGVEFTDKPNAYGKYQGTSSNHDKVIGEVIHDLLHKRHRVVDGKEGLRTVGAIEKIYENAILIDP
jgi:predicted dehydrogenase